MPEPRILTVLLHQSDRRWPPVTSPLGQVAQLDDWVAFRIKVTTGVECKRYGWSWQRSIQKKSWLCTASGKGLPLSNFVL